MPSGTVQNASPPPEKKNKSARNYSNLFFRNVNFFDLGGGGVGGTDFYLCSVCVITAVKYK